MQQIKGLAAEFSGAKLCINVAMAMFVCVGGICPNTCSKSNTMYGDQHSMNTMTMTNVILTVLTFAFGIMPRELARRLLASANPAPVRPAALANTDPLAHIVFTIIA